MKRLSLQWRITLMSVLLIGITCVAMNLLLCSSGVYYMDTIADSLQGSGTVILNEEGTASFDPQLVAPSEELTIVVDGAQGRFRTTNWYITAILTLLSGILAYFVSGRALKLLHSFASQVEKVQLNNLADVRIDEDVLPEFRQHVLIDPHIRQIVQLHLLYLRGEAVQELEGSPADEIGQNSAEQCQYSRDIPVRGAEASLRPIDNDGQLLAGRNELRVKACRTFLIQDHRAAAL